APRTLSVMPRSSEHRDAWIVATLAFLARALVVLWAANRFPAAADGFYYDRLAQRVAEGLGSTWLWPDGKVTYAAHYPIGYPAMFALAYRLLGPIPSSGAWLNALIGTLAAVAAHGLALRATSRGWALAAGLTVALHPALVLYTPALMTEGVTASLLVVA